MSFSRYAAIVKNLRGVVLLDVDEPGVEDSLKWLVKRFKYRDLGLTPIVANRYHDRLAKYLNGKPFRVLVSPVAYIIELVEKLSKNAQILDELAELIIYSSIYISPGVVIGKRYLHEVSRISTSAVNTCKELTINDWKLHLRIADYTILDFYEECVNEAYSVLERGDYSKIRDIMIKRKKRIEKDKKRYWRISCNDGHPFLYYLDVLELVISSGMVDLLQPDHSAALSIIPIVYIPPGLS